MNDQIIQFLTLDVPKPQKEAIGFLELIKKQYHENINSSVYAYFINCQEKAVSDLFLNALRELILEKSEKDFSFGKPVAWCEVVTKEGRIDIVVEDELGPNKIIIENKIFHHLHNDLMDYWNHYPIPEEDKMGVLLTPYPHAIPEEVKSYFINITHGEWIAKVKAAGLPFGTSTKNTIYITDFIQTIESLSTTYEMNDQAKFYFQHAPKILQIQDTVGAAHQFLNSQFQLIAEKLGWQVYGNSMNWRNFWDEENHLQTYLTIITEKLIRGEMKFTLILELEKEDKNKADDLANQLMDNEQFKRMKRGAAISNSMLHFGMIEYEITETELGDLAHTVLKKIKEDFASVTLESVKFLHPSKDISKWEGNFKSLI